MLINSSKTANLKIANSEVIFISDASDIGAARRLAAALAKRLDFAEAEIEKIAIITTELASNLMKHACKNAQLFLQAIEHDNKQGLEILALDKAQGMNNVAQCLKDGYSTANTSGTGLGAISRLADFINIYTQPDAGTLVLARVYKKQNQQTNATLLELGSVCLPYPGEKLCGDTWAVHQSAERSVFLLADGLGHGFDAAEASQQACDIFQQNNQLGPAELIKILSTNLRNTRGAAIAVAEIDKNKKTVTFSGLGNISGNIITDKKIHRMISHDGTAGIGQYTVREFVYPWCDKSLLIMHSDGITSRWDLNNYPGITLRDPTVIASILYRDFWRGNDDVTVIVAKQKMADVSNNLC